MIADVLLAPARWVADRAWYALAGRVLPALDDNLVDVDDAPALFDGLPIGARLDADIPGCDR